MTQHLKNHIFISLLLSLSIFAQSKNLTFEQAYLFAEPRLLQALPNVSTYTMNENSYLLTEGKKIKIINLFTKSEKLFLDYEELNKNLPSGFDLSRAVAQTDDYKKFVLSKDSDLYLYDRAKNVFTKISNDESEEKNPTFSPDENFIAYTKSHNLFVYDIVNSKEIQLTNDGSNVVYNGYASWIYYEEILGRG